MAHVELGNVSHTAVITEPETGKRVRYRSRHIVRSTTSVGNLPADLLGALQTVVNVWGHESDQPPAWVESDDEALSSALRSHFGCGGRPEDWTNEFNDLPPGLEPIETPAGAVTPEVI